MNYTKILNYTTVDFSPFIPTLIEKVKGKEVSGR